jgi:hypothetical protein
MTTYVYNNIEIIVSPEVKLGIPKDSEPDLVKSVSSFIEAGFIVENDNKEVIIDVPLIHRIVQGSENIRTYSNKYGTDNQGFVLYKKWAESQ